MSLWENLEEQLEPGPVGHFEVGPPPREPRPRRRVIARGIVGLAMVAVPLVIASLVTPFSTVAWVALGLELYLAVAYYVRPCPACPTLGWRNMFDNPFRYTDDVDWTLWFLSVVLRPGRFASTTIADLLHEPSRPAVGG